jgi:catechol 2,3-dioxygenase-like lactoylglutathione lyase family enzyme
MAGFPVTRAGAILAVADLERSLAFYRDVLGLAVDALFDDPPYAILSVAGTRISLAEQGHAAPDHDVLLRAQGDPANTPAMLVLEVEDALAVHRRLVAEGAGDRLVAPVFSPPWGGHRFFLRDPDGYLVEIEQPA